MQNNKNTPSPAFGELAASAPHRMWLGLCHRDHGPWYSRLIAPLLRRQIVRHSPLPVDLDLNGLRMRCMFRDNYSEKKFVFTPWRYDRQERQLLRQHLGKTGVFLDIGANVGIYTLTALTSPGFNGRILAFEPNPVTRERLQTNLAANNCNHDDARVQVMPIGIADSHSQFTLQLDGHNLGASSISQHNRSRLAEGQGTQVVIDCKPLLDVLETQNVRHIDVIKIDIEGAEDKAMAPYLAQAPDELLARLVIIENSQHLWQQDVFELLKQRGYQRILHNRMNSAFYRPAL
jgi:FkbM family methyltransferase